MAMRTVVRGAVLLDRGPDLDPLPIALSGACSVAAAVAGLWTQRGSGQT
jgi:hypothetical protein